MQHKGFAKAPSQLLINGWLLRENSKHYRFKSNAFVLESLPMTLNMWLAMASERFASGKNQEKNTLSTLTLIAELDTEVTNKSKQQARRWHHQLRTDDQFYVDYCKRLLQLVKNAIASGQYAELNGCIQNTWEYKQWMQEAGYLLVTPNLKDGWLHPLSEFSTFNGEEAMNCWAVASLLVAAATERTTDGGDKETCITRLIQLGVLDVETNFKARLEVAHFMDAEYLEIIGQVKEALDAAFVPNQSHS
jgi:hypothetical protein